MRGREVKEEINGGRSRDADGVCRAYRLLKGLSP